MAAPSAAPRSFVEIAADSHFPLQNLPYGIFKTPGDARPRAGVAIGDYVLDLAALEEAGLLAVGPAGERVFARAELNAFIAIGRRRSRHRSRIGERLRYDNGELRTTAHAPRARAVPRREHRQIPVDRRFTIYSSKEHATNVGSRFAIRRNALMPTAACSIA